MAYRLFIALPVFQALASMKKGERELFLERFMAIQTSPMEFADISASDADVKILRILSIRDFEG